MAASSARPDLYFFDDAERALTRRALDAVEEQAPAQAGALRDELRRLRQAADLVSASPSVSGKIDDGLLDLLCQVPDWDLDLHVPLRVTFGQAYLTAKIGFLESLAQGLDAAGAAPELCERARFEVGQSIYSKLAEELFVSIVTDRLARRTLKVAAARALIRIWEERLQAEIDDFAPALESIWVARNKLRPAVGTTLGTSEFFRLVNECCDTRFVDYFGQDVPQEQLQAFEEFLFGLGYEELAALREAMQSRGITTVTPEQASELIGGPPSWSPDEDGPHALYTSYKRRRVRARFRALTNAPGPRRTAEEFVMRSLLVRDAPAR